MSARSVAPVSSLKILVGAMAVIPLRFRVFARALAIPFVLYTAFDSVWLMQSAVALYERFPWLMFGLTELVELTLYTIAAVATHRAILLGASSVPRYGIEWARHTTRFFTLALLLASANYAAAFLARGLVMDRIEFDWFLSALVWSTIPTFVVLVLMFVIARLLLVFPAAAVGQSMTFRRSWELTRHRKLLMVLIAVVYPTLVNLPTIFIPESSTAGYLLRSIASLPALIVTVILLSFAYQQLRKEPMPPEH